jgi:hypothetical protein
MNTRLAVVVIWSLILADLLTGLLYNLGSDFYRVGLVIKGVLIFFTLIYYLTKVKVKTIQSIYLVVVVLIVCWVIGTTVSYFNNLAFGYAYSFVVLNRYLFFLILCCLFVEMRGNEAFAFQCNKVLDWFFVLNNSLIGIGFFLNVDLFSTFDPWGEYESGQRFGYKGLIVGGNEVAGVYLFGLAHFFRKVMLYREGKPWLLVMTFISAILTGTRATLIGSFLLGIYFTFRYRLSLLILVVVPFIAFLVHYVSSNWDAVREKYLSFMIHAYNNRDIVSFLTSGRNSTLGKNLSYVFSEWSIVNFVTGDGFLYNEMDFFDLYFFFGVGSLLYLYVYARIFFIRDKSLNNVFVFSVLMSVAFIAGHILQSTVVPLFMLLYVFASRVDMYGSIGNNRSH